MEHGVQYGTGTRRTLKVDTRKIRIVETQCWREERRKFRRQIKLGINEYSVYERIYTQERMKLKKIWKIVREKEKRRKWIGRTYVYEMIRG